MSGDVENQEDEAVERKTNNTDCGVYVATGCLVVLCVIVIYTKVRQGEG